VKWQEKTLPMSYRKLEKEFSKLMAGMSMLVWERTDEREKEIRIN
jgi:hypothetical protein